MMPVEKCRPDKLPVWQRLEEERPDDLSMLCAGEFLNAYIDMASARPNPTDEQIDKIFQLVSKATPIALAENKSRYASIEDAAFEAARILKRRIKEWERKLRYEDEALTKEVEELLDWVNIYIEAEDEHRTHCKIAERLATLQRELDKAKTRYGKILAIEKFVSTQHDHGFVLDYPCEADRTLADAIREVLDCVREA